MLYMSINEEEFFEESNLADEIAKQQMRFQEKIPDFDNRPNTLGNVLCSIKGQNNYDLKQMMQFILSQMSVNQADTYGLRNIFCPLYGIIPNNGSKTQIMLHIVITEKTTLYAELPNDNVNNYYADASDGLGTIFRIAKTTTFEPGEYDVLFMATEYGSITCNINTITNIDNPIFGWESVNNPQEPISIGSEAETDEEIRKKLIKISPIYSTENLLQGLKKKLLNIGCKDCKIYYSTEYNELKDKYGIPYNSLYVICIDGNRDDIFDVLFNNTLGIKTYGNETKTEYIDNFPYSVSFDYNNVKEFYLNFTIHCKTTSESQLITLRNQIADKFNDENNSILTQELNISKISSIVWDCIKNIFPSGVYSDNYLLGLEVNKIDKKQLYIDNLKNIFSLKADNIIVDVVYD